MIPPMTEPDEQPPGKGLAAAGYAFAGFGILIVVAMLALIGFFVWLLFMSGGFGPD